MGGEKARPEPSWGRGSHETAAGRRGRARFGECGNNMAHDRTRDKDAPDRK